MVILITPQDTSAHGTELIFTTHGMCIICSLSIHTVSCMIIPTEDIIILKDIRTLITEPIIEAIVPTQTEEEISTVQVVESTIEMAELP